MVGSPVQHSMLCRYLHSGSLKHVPLLCPCVNVHPWAPAGVPPPVCRYGVEGGRWGVGQGCVPFFGRSKRGSWITWADWWHGTASPGIPGLRWIPDPSPVNIRQGDNGNTTISLDSGSLQPGKAGEGLQMGMAGSLGMSFLCGNLPICSPLFYPGSR